MRIIRRDYENGYYDGLFTQEMPNSQRNQNRLHALLGRVQKGHLLEVGCGKGGFLTLAEQCFDVEGIDISHAAVDTMKPHFGSRVNVYNIEQRPLKADAFNIVAAFNVLEHLRQPHKVVNKLFHSLTKDGFLFGSVPNNYGAVGGIATLLSNFFDRTHISTFTPATWERIFRHAGFSKVDFFGELTIGPNRSYYLHGKHWQHLAFNLMFFCQKT